MPHLQPWGSISYLGRGEPAYVVRWGGPESADGRGVEIFSKAMIREKVWDT